MDAVESVDPQPSTGQGSIAAETARFFEDLASPGPQEDREVFAYAWIARCLRSGAAGIAELRGWLASDQDISFETGKVIARHGDEEEGGDLRDLILSSMERWPQSDAVAVATEILHDPNHVDEITEAVEQLDLHEPGKHRAEIMSRLRQLFDGEDRYHAMEIWLKQAVTYHDPAMLAEVESRAAGDDSLAGKILGAAYALPPKQSQIALSRLAGQPALLRDAAHQNPDFLSRHAFEEGWIRTFTAQTLFPSMTAEAQANMLSRLGSGIFVGGSMSPNAIDLLLFGYVPPPGTSTGNPDLDLPGSTFGKDRLAFLDLIRPNIRDPNVLRAWEQAREEVQRSIAEQTRTMQSAPTLGRTR
jgi:hypothetical protein